MLAVQSLVPSTHNPVQVAIYEYAHQVADAQVKAGAGFLHTITFTSEDAVPTAGTITVYDSLTETGTVIAKQYITAAAFNGFTLTIDAKFNTGCYVGFATTGDVGVTVSFL